MSEVLRELKDDAGALINAAAQTATFNSETLNISQCDRWGVIFDISAAAGTMEIKVQMSIDGGTTWLDTYPEAVNSETQATLAQITTSAIETSKFWDRFLPAEGIATDEGGTDYQPRVRLVFTLASTPSYTFTSAKIVRIRYRN